MILTAVQFLPENPRELPLYLAAEEHHLLCHPIVSKLLLEKKL
jgi:hypothetical protein